MPAEPKLLLHGGAGVKPGRDYAAVTRHLHILAAGLSSALDRGMAAIDAVEEAVAAMEESGLYVAGRGSAPARDGRVEMDASVMDGARGRAGGVGALAGGRGAVGAARAVLEHSHHVLLVGEGAAEFARRHGALVAVPGADWFRLPPGVEADDLLADEAAGAHGTVGAVALDRAGRLAAATATGGLFGKRPGRLGDSGIPGVGAYADERVAISCTGVGEAFILANGAADIAARMRYGAASLADACDGLLARVAYFGGDGGVIALAADGTHAARWNSPGLKHAVASATSGVHAAIG